MKKIFIIIFFTIIIVLPSLACANKAFLHRQTGRTLTATALDGTLTKTEDVPLWAKGAETEKKLFQGLNLDGIGGSDDEVYISIYQFGDYEEDRIIVMRIHLGTGETIAEIFPIDGHYSFQTGRLFSKNKNAIVLEIRNPTSNYGAAQIFVIDIIAGGTDSDHPSASAVVRLDTTVHTAAEPFALVSGGRTLDFNAVTFGTQIVHVRNRPLQGLKIYLADSEGEWHKRYEILYWTDTKHQDKKDAEAGRG